ncbi:MAG: FAD-dependent oxidoreductase [Rhodobacteraceae bacterium]|nr:FAD-dependent oxidoreductase [Paracoccaceae bacterium]
MVDVTIRGAGIFGLSIAWTCVRRGAKVRVIDPYGPGAGASGGIVGALAPHVPENWKAKTDFQFESLILAETFWADVAAAGGVSPGYARIGRLQPIADGHTLGLAHQRAENAKTLWRGKAKWAVLPAAEIGDWCPPSPSGFVIHDTLSARIHPRRAIAALVAGLQASGVEIVTEAPEQGLVLHATGVADLKDLSHKFGKDVGNGVKGQAALLRYDAGDAPQLFADFIHIIPHDDGTVAIGSSSERFYDDPTGTDDALDDIIARVVAAVPVLQGAEVMERWASVRPRAKSRAPMLGAHPLYPDQFIANGGFKIGFGVAPKIAEIMADLMLDGIDNVHVDFRVEASL